MASSRNSPAHSPPMHPPVPFTTSILQGYPRRKGQYQGYHCELVTGVGAGRGSWRSWKCGRAKLGLAGLGSSGPRHIRIPRRTRYVGIWYVLLSEVKGCIELDDAYKDETELKQELASSNEMSQKKVAEKFKAEISGKSAKKKSRGAKGQGSVPVSSSSEECVMLSNFSGLSKGAGHAGGARGAGRNRGAGKTEAAGGSVAEAEVTFCFSIHWLLRRVPVSTALCAFRRP